MRLIIGSTSHLGKASLLCFILAYLSSCEGLRCFSCEESFGCSMSRKHENITCGNSDDVCLTMRSYQLVPLMERRCMSMMEMDCYKTEFPELEQRNASNKDCFKLPREKMMHCTAMVKEADKPGCPKNLVGSRKTVVAQPQPTTNTSSNGSEPTNTTSTISITVNLTEAIKNLGENDTVEICYCSTDNCNSQTSGANWNYNKVILLFYLCLPLLLKNLLYLV